MFLTLLPAYGRDYKSKKAILNDLNAFKDFIVSCFEACKAGYKETIIVTITDEKPIINTE